jgi:uncharacterized damage-inducible protein DinB
METTSTPRSEPFISRLWQPHPAGLLELWQHEAPRTLRVFRSFGDADLSFRAKGGGRSVAELLQHVADSYRLTVHWLSDVRPTAPRRTALPSTVDEAVALSASAQAALFAALAALPEAAFERQIAPFGVAESRAVFALGMLKHEIHHRGELFSLARVCGRAPEGLYVPVG